MSEDERAYQRKDAMLVRGNAYSFPMPWDGITAKLKKVIDGEVQWDELPHSGDVLAKTVLFSLRIGNVSPGLLLVTDRFFFVFFRTGKRVSYGAHFTLGTFLSA